MGRLEPGRKSKASLAEDDSDYDYAYAWRRRRYHRYDPKKKRKIVNCAIHTHESRMEVLLFFRK